MFKYAFTAYQSIKMTSRLHTNQLTNLQSNAKIRQNSECRIQSGCNDDVCMKCSITHIFFFVLVTIVNASYVVKQ